MRGPSLLWGQILDRAGGPLTHGSFDELKRSPESKEKTIVTSSLVHQRFPNGTSLVDVRIHDKVGVRSVILVNSLRTTFHQTM